MNGLTPINTNTVYLELGQSSLNVLLGEAGLELPLERLENGHLTAPCQEWVIASLQAFLKRPGHASSLPAICAVGARGVSFRRLIVPPATNEELTRLLSLQIESEFPLPPADLAWGYRKLERGEQPKEMPAGHQAFLVAALKKEILEEYAEMLGRSGIRPVFTLAALARNYLWPCSSESSAALDIGRRQSELIYFERGVPTSFRILPWGGDNITESIQEKMGVTREEAETLKIRGDRESATSSEAGPIVESTTAVAVDVLTKFIRAKGPAQRLYLTGKSARQKGVAAQLAKGLDCSVEVERTEGVPGSGRSAAIQGLKKSRDKNGHGPLLIIQVKDGKIAAKATLPGARKLGTIAGALLLACLCLPYVEALLLKPHLASRLAAAQGSRGKLASIDREFDFLRLLKKSQPPYMDAMYLMANFAPPGTRFDSLSMNRRGEVSLRGNMKDSQQVLVFRSKLIDSGFFSSVVVEEQSPTPDRQKLVVRMTAQWKTTTDREKLKLGPTPEEMEKIRATAKELGPGGSPMPMGGAFPMPPGAFPPGRESPGMPPGVRSGVPVGPGSVMPPSAGPPAPMPPLEKK